LADQVQHNSNLGAKVDELSRSSQDHEHTKRALRTSVDDNTRISKMYADRNDEIEALRRRIAELEGRGSMIDGLHNRVRNLEGENDQLRNTLGARMKDLERMYRQLAEYHSIEGNILETTFNKMKSETDAMLHTGRA